MPPRDYQSIPNISSEEEPFNSYNTRRGKPRGNLFCFQVIGFLALGAAIAGGVLVVLRNRPSHHFHKEIQKAKSQVHVDPKDGSYSVHYDAPFTTDMTFVQLANRMLPPWYEASLMSIADAIQDDNTLKPSTVKECRKTLLMTRSLLDAFSPVFPKHSLWAKLRKQYKKGYEVIGYYQDLNHSGVDYGDELLEERRQDVLDWKASFEKFNNQHLVRFFVYEEADLESCVRHESSHLFWDDLMELPCGGDSAVSSLHRLGAVQMHHCKDYFQQMKNISSVLEEEQMSVFHDLRKEIRLFLDECDLFGDIFMEDNPEGLKILDKTQKDLGHLHDDWVAYDIYVRKDTHRVQQKELALNIDKNWAEFMDWATSNDLEGIIQKFLDYMEQ